MWSFEQSPPLICAFAKPNHDPNVHLIEFYHVFRNISKYTLVYTISIQYRNCYQKNTVNSNLLILFFAKNANLTFSDIWNFFWTNWCKDDIKQWRYFFGEIRILKGNFLFIYETRFSVMLSMLVSQYTYHSMWFKAPIFDATFVGMEVFEESFLKGVRNLFGSACKVKTVKTLTLLSHV